MLEFNLQGKLLGVLDADIAYQPLSGTDASAYGLSQQNNLQPELAFDPLNAQDPLSALANEAQNQSAAALNLPRTALWSQGTPIQNPTSQPAGFGADPSQTDQGSDRQQDNSDPAQIDLLTDGHLGGRDILSTQPTTSPDLLTLNQANQAGPTDLNTAQNQLDPLTGDTEVGFFGFVPKPIVFEIDPDLLSYFGERAEVNNLLAEDRFDRDQSTGTETHYNFTMGSGFSAHEGSGYDVTDSFHNAADIGTVAYRDDKEVIGTVGYRSGWTRDTNDYFSFYAGKTGTFDISLTGLSADVGLLLYDERGKFIAHSNKWGTQDENISLELEEGHYTSRIYSYNSSWWNNKGATAFNLNISRQADVFEQWTNALIDDSSVNNAMLNSIKLDNEFSREDVIGVLKSAGDYGSVTGTEFTDLQQFWLMSNSTMRADIAGLSKKVVFGDAANDHYTGYDSIVDDLGNLESGTSTQNLNLLIGKHMLGTDRPMIHTGTYTQAGGTLEVDGYSAGDIDQGATGSCYFLSALAGTADKKVSIIEDMFTDNGDGTYSVRFYTNGQADYVTVDSMMATKADGTYLHADTGVDDAIDAVVADHNELWVALAEKAYAQLNESGRLNQEEDTNRYGIAGDEGISWGFTTDAITHITGLNSSWGNASASGIGVTNVSSEELQTLVNSDRVVCAGWGGHARTIMSYDEVTGEYEIRNPYDKNHSSLTHTDLVNLGAGIAWSNS